MTVSRTYGVLALLGAVALAGCGPSNAPPPRVKTGAEQVARDFFTDLVNKDWAAAYGHLDAPSKAGCGSEQFARLAQAYYEGLGFEPSEVIVQSCDERDNEAVAHVNLKGVSGATAKYYKDAVGLRHETAGWAVALPSTFGKPKSAKG